MVRYVTSGRYGTSLRPSFKAQFDYSGLNDHQQQEFRDFIINSDTVKLKSLKKDTIILKEQNADLAKQNQKIIEQNIQLKHALFQIATAMNLEFQNPEAAKEAKFASYRVRD